MSETPINVISDQIERIRKELKKYRYSDIAEKTGLHVNTVRNIANGTHAAPTLKNIQALSDILFPKG